MTLWHETRGQGTDLVLLHGWGMNAAVWEPLLPALQDHYRVTRVDLPGHGFSPLACEPGGDGSASELASWTAMVADSVPENAFWLGWSLGGLLALQAALDPAIRTRGLMMMTATPCFTARDDWPCAMPVDTLQQFAVSLEEDATATLARFLSLQIRGCDNSRQLRKQLQQHFAGRPVAQMTALRSGLSLLRDTDFRNRLSELQIPGSWVYGGRDTLTPACAAATIRDSLPQARVEVIDDAAHVPFLSHPDRVLKALQQLVTEA